QTSGSFSVTVEVSDSLGFYSNSTVLVLTVHPALGVTAAPNVTALDVGQTVEFVATPSGGSGGLSYAWSPVGTATCSASGPTYACLPHSSGTLSVTVSATDIAGSRVSASASSVVSSDPSATLRASRTTVDAGRTDTLTVTATGGRLDAAGSGGVTNYSLSWTGLPTSCTAGAALSAICSWDAAGTYPIEVRVIDANGFLSAPASLTVTVVPSLSVTLQESPSQALAGQTVLISAVTLGGSGALHFAWSGLPSGCSAITGANLTCQVPGSGTFDVKVTVTDGAGGNATASSTLTVAASFLGLPELEGYAVLGGVLGIVAVSAAALYLVSRRRRRAPPSSEVPAEPDVPAE
ncbi:MAG TPA: hypothetical protein VGS23_08390, partial [Thermoplasmata archaeon]|nr:hypothetical protein [Thermoplasmata archaeon]